MHFEEKFIKTLDMVQGNSPKVSVMTPDSSNLCPVDSDEEEFESFLSKLKKPQDGALPASKKSLDSILDSPCASNKSDDEFENILSSVRKKAKSHEESSVGNNLVCKLSDSENSKLDDEFENYICDLKTPIMKIKRNASSNLTDSCTSSDNEEEFEKFLSNLKTPKRKTPFNENIVCQLSYSENSRSDEEYESFMSSVKTPQCESIKKEDISKATGSLNSSLDDEKEFENFISSLKKKEIRPKFKSSLNSQVSNSEERSSSDEEFENSISTMKTPKINPHNKENISDSLISSPDEKEFENFLSNLKTLKLDSSPAKTPKETPVSKIPFGSSHSTQKSATESLKDIEERVSKNFTGLRQKCSKDLYAFFNKRIFAEKLPVDMPVKWTGALMSTAGMFKGKGYENGSIELSSPILTSYDKLRDTLLHEMCHAACWIINRSRCGHGPLWRTWAARCNVIFPELEVPTRCHNYEIKFNYELRCVSCQWKRKRLKMCPKLQSTKCPLCRSSTQLFQL